MRLLSGMQSIDCIGSLPAAGSGSGHQTPYQSGDSGRWSSELENNLNTPQPTSTSSQEVAPNQTTKRHPLISKWSEYSRIDSVRPMSPTSQEDEEEDAEDRLERQRVQDEEETVRNEEVLIYAPVIRSLSNRRLQSDHLHYASSNKRRPSAHGTMNSVRNSQHFQLSTSDTWKYSDKLSKEPIKPQVVQVVRKPKDLHYLKTDARHDSSKRWASSDMISNRSRVPSRQSSHDPDYAELIRSSLFETSSSMRQGTSNESDPTEALEMISGEFLLKSRPASLSASQLVDLNYSDCSSNSIPPSIYGQHVNQPKATKTNTKKKSKTLASQLQSYFFVGSLGPKRKNRCNEEKPQSSIGRDVNSDSISFSKNFNYFLAQERNANASGRSSWNTLRSVRNDTDNEAERFPLPNVYKKNFIVKGHSTCGMYSKRHGAKGSGSETMNTLDRIDKSKSLKSHSILNANNAESSDNSNRCQIKAKANTLKVNDKICNRREIMQSPCKISAWY